MTKYYTRACNFFYGQDSRQLVKKKITLPLCNDSSISFNQIELFSRNKKIVKNKIVDLKNIKKLPKKIFKTTMHTKLLELLCQEDAYLSSSAILTEFRKSTSGKC